MAIVAVTTTTLANCGRGAAPADVLCQGKPSDKIATAAGQTIEGTPQRDVLSAGGPVRAADEVEAYLRRSAP